MPFILAELKILLHICTRKTEFIRMRQNDDFVAQLVEQLTLNQWAEGSSPSEVTENKPPTFVGGFLFMLVFLLFKQVVLTNNHVPERFRKRPNYNDDSSQPITRISYIRH